VLASRDQDRVSRLTDEPLLRRFGPLSGCWPGPSSWLDWADVVVSLGSIGRRRECRMFGPGRIVSRVSTPDEQPPGDRLDALQPEQVAAFSSLSSPSTLADQALRDDEMAASALVPRLNLGLARRVYAG
jgi:hypothetical protein